MGNPDLFVVLNADIMGDYPLREFVEFHMQHLGEHSILATEVHSIFKIIFFLQYKHRIIYNYFPVRLTLVSKNSECIWLASWSTNIFMNFGWKGELVQKYLILLVILQGT